MKVYRWNPTDRQFAPAPAGNDIPSNERVLLQSLQIDKGAYVRSEGVTRERMICLLRGSWRMSIADSDLVVRRNEAVVIPSGFDHYAEAIEDSFALQLEREANEDDYLWGV
ncbi:MAG TPA: hypothetical protein VEZ90_03390 [Blastocatellia bacterium]|nr:hypothetical protein [Blastocatellia bacterium]